MFLLSFICHKSSKATTNKRGKLTTSNIFNFEEIDQFICETQDGTGKPRIETLLKLFIRIEYFISIKLFSDHILTRLEQFKNNMMTSTLNFTWWVAFFLFAPSSVYYANSFTVQPDRVLQLHSRTVPMHFMVPIDNEPLDFDDDDFFEDDEDAQMFAQVTKKQQIDLSGCSIRQFNLGYDLIINDYVGSLGFEEVTDWEYYQPSLVNNERKMVEPPPFDPSQPKRTREKSGSVVRIFRGELSGRLGSSARSRGLDSRILLKEFSGEVRTQISMKA